jgi:nicotinate-nucleotide adenylyltransferase
MDGQTVGILGGTFNPIHNGHIEIARLAHEQFDIPLIYVMPSGNPASYKDVTDVIAASDRCNMVKAAIQQYPFMKLSTMEIERKGYTYTSDTLLEISDKFKSIYFIIGADSLLYLDKWKRPDIICSHCTLLAANRDNKNMSVLMEKKHLLEKEYGAVIHFINVPELPFSSTSIRTAIRNNQDISEMVPKGVSDYIIRNDLYKM